VQEQTNSHILKKIRRALTAVAASPQLASRMKSISRSTIRNLILRMVALIYLKQWRIIVRHFSL
jgi:hypothetical protein